MKPKLPLVDRIAIALLRETEYGWSGLDRRLEETRWALLPNAVRARQRAIVKSLIRTARNRDRGR